MNKRVVALTGGIGSGKSSVANVFADLGATIVDSDAISHQLTGVKGAALPALQNAFGMAIVGPDGALDREQMRELAFKNPAVRQSLESILHPMIGAEAQHLIAAATSPYVIRVIPLLVEGGDPHRRFARVLVVDCDEEKQIARVIARGGLSRAEVEAIMATQAGRAERLAHADDIIDNNGEWAEVLPQVDRLHRLYLELTAA